MCVAFRIERPLIQRGLQNLLNENHKMQIVKYRHRVKGFLGGASDKNPACLGGASDKNPACQRRRQKRFLVRFLGGEDPLEVGTTIQSSVLA